MAHPDDPLSAIPDAPLFVVPRMLEQLRGYTPAAGPDGPGADAARAEVGRLVARLLAGIEAHPTRFWVMTQFRQSLAAVRPEAYGLVYGEVQRIAAIVGVEAAVGILEGGTGAA